MFVSTKQYCRPWNKYPAQSRYNFIYSESLLSLPSNASQAPTASYFPIIDLSLSHYYLRYSCVNNKQKKVMLIYRMPINPYFKTLLRSAVLGIILSIIISMEITSVSSDPSPSPAVIYKELKDRLSPDSEVLLATNTNLTDAGFTVRWNAFDAPSYVVYAKPANNHDVKTIVQYASKANVPFLATGGGSGYTNTTAALKGAIGVDLGNFKSISIDANGNRMTVGGGVIFDDIFDPLHAVGKEIQNNELFWGIRGAGQNFGIVTSATYRVHDQTNNGTALNGDFVYPASAKESIFQLIKSIENDQPDELSIFPSIMFDMPTQATAIMVSLIYIGPEEKGMSYMQPFIDSSPIRQSVGLLPWNKLIKENRFGVDAMACAKGGDHAVFGLNVNEFDVATYVGLVDDFDAFYAQNPANILSILVLELFPNRVARSVPDEETAYPYRDSTGHMLLSFTFQDEAASVVAKQFALKTRSKLLEKGCRKSPLEVYVNYAHGDEGPVAWYSERKLPRLRALKSRWDPKNLFKWTNGVLQ
ncbi:FAD binding domain-containing protein [Xylaria venustula]|nr:FAD binding domain-containing protein [Xylaria venustula]